MSETPEYRSHAHAKGRCNNPNDTKYADYGARGIKFLFASFEQFFAELGPRPNGKTLDRYPNNEGHYEPGNVRWATPLEQAQNRRNRGKAQQKSTSKTTYRIHKGEAAMEGNKVRLVVKISPDQKAALEKMRAKSGVTVSEIVRRLITAGLKRA